MKIKLKSGSTVINVLIAVAISLLANFSYLVYIILASSGRQLPNWVGQDNTLFLILEALFYFLLAFILLTVFTIDLDGNGLRRGSFWKKLLLCTVITFGLYFCSPIYNHRTDEIMIMMMVPARRMFNPMIVLKCSFTLAVAALYGKIFELLHRNQNILVENERLRSENLQSRYNVLVTQINPHFFFNSLNSLSSLVRGGRKEDSLLYIDRLSDTFRYIIQTGNTNLATLREELEFLEAYKYVFEVRYAGKLFIEVDVDESLQEMVLPSLSLQPLIENAVKHNTITKAAPLHINITADDGYLTVSNPLAPKIEPEPGMGTGLKNLSSRYMLLVGKDIEVENNGKRFTVRLPLSGKTK